ncbi:MAG: fasciclin domain-containing protein, partial [Anaerolineae bacterium]|nr:fasciclin domain-containing protein [Anaerolineae bacterium]
VAEAATEEPTREPNAADEIVDEDVMGTIVDVAVANKSFSTLIAAIAATELTGTLSEGGPYTFFAPSNDAFTTLLEELDMNAETLFNDTELLTSIVRYHVVEGELFEKDIVAMDSEEIKTLENEMIAISVTDEGVVLNNMANMIESDILSSNGVIHMIDAVLVPPSLTTAIYTATPTQGTVSLNNVYAIVNVDVANLRSGPGTNYGRAGSASRGTEFVVFAYYGDWYQIETDDGEAWIWSGIVQLQGDSDAIELATNIPEPPVVSSASQPNNTSVGNSSECNPGQWDACGANGCEPSESAQCNDQGTGWVCVSNPATCGGGGGAPPPPSDSATCLYHYSDYLQLQACFFKDPATNPQCQQWDLNSDGVIDTADYVIMANNYCGD